MDLVIPPELEDLILCSCCHLPFNETDAPPKLFSCRHHFCLKCVNSILLKGTELYCVHCWKRTELPGPDMKAENLPTYNAILYLSQNLSMLNFKSKPPDKQQQQQQSSANQQQQSLQSSNNNNNTSNKSKKGENCITHAMPNALWCTKCSLMLCRACAGSEEHRNHIIRTKAEAKNTIHDDIGAELATMQKILNEVQHLVLKQRDFLLKILESCTALKTQIETELINHLPTLEIAEMRESLSKAKLCLDMLEQQSPAEAYKLYSTLNIEKQRLQSKHQEMYLQCKLDDLIRHYSVLFDFDLIKQALATIHTNESYSTINGIGHHNPILLLANYCISQLYSRHVLSAKHSPIVNSGNYHMPNVPQQQSQSQQQQQQQQQQQSQQQQQQSSQQQQLISSQSSCEVVSTKTYADITSSPTGAGVVGGGSGNQSKTNYTNSLSDGLSAAAPGTRSQSSTSSGAAAYVSELNGISASTMALMQHQFQQQHSNHVQQKTQLTSNSVQSTSQTATLMCNPSVHVYPIFFFNVEMNGSPCGRILIEVRNDVAPKMAKNFAALSTGELGFGYKGCQIFQCWENESIITGDFELNNGRGGRSVFEESFFMPDDTKILAIRGSVGMRRSQKRHDNLGLVGSQFRIILREMRGFTGIFAFVIEGLELVEKISQTGDSAGKPQSNIVIANCGKLQ